MGKAVAAVAWDDKAITRAVCVNLERHIRVLRQVKILD